MRRMLDKMMSLAVLGTSDTVPLFGNASVGLFAAPLTPTVNTTFAQLTEATYDGYARQALGAATAPFIGQGGLSLAHDLGKVWTPTGSNTPNTIYGQFLIGDASTKLYAVEVFDAPIVMNGPTTLFGSIIYVGLDPAANYGKSSVSN